MNLIIPEIRDRIHFEPVEGALRVRLCDSITEYDIDGVSLSVYDESTFDRYQMYLQASIRALRGERVRVYMEVVTTLLKKRHVCLLGHHKYLKELADMIAEDASSLSMHRVPFYWGKQFESMFGEGVYRG